MTASIHKFFFIGLKMFVFGVQEIVFYKQKYLIFLKTVHQTNSGWQIEQIQV